MRVGRTVEAENLLGFKARKLRRSLKLTQQELANLAGVLTKEVILFEHNMPVQLDVKRKLLREL
jgi:DNA-binding XRE family transcriptional regulator